MERYKKQKRRKKTQQQLVILVVVIAIIALIVYGLGPFFQGCPDGIPVLGGSIAVHIHVHLDVFVNASSVTVPDTLGHVGATFCALHTHDSTGVIHDESPDTRTYTVQQIFDVWGYSLPSGAKVYVNGQIDDFSHILVTHDEIAVVIGTPPATIPSSYNFPAALTP